MTEEDDVVAVFAGTREAYGRLDALVNNAGVGIGAPMEEIQTKHLDMQLAVNLRALILGTREGLPMLREAGAEHGKALIVNTASIAGKGGQAWLSIYAATKAAVINFTQSTHREAGGAGIQCTALAPGFVDTPMTEFAKGQVPAEQMIRPERPRRGGALPAANLAQLPCPGDCLHPTRRGHSIRLPERRSLGGGPCAAGDAKPRAFLVAAFGDPGHAFPAIALGRALAGRGHEVVVETWEERRGAVEGAGLGFAAAEEYRMFPPPDPDSRRRPARGRGGAGVAAAAGGDAPHVVVSDILTLAPTLAAERAGIPLATLIPHIYPVVEPGLPFFAIGLRPPRTAVGRALWRRASGRSTSASSTAVATSTCSASASAWRRSSASMAASAPIWPWSPPTPSSSTRGNGPPGVEVTGPMTFEMPHPEIELPPGDVPLVLVAPSTAHDSDNQLVRTALAALAEEPVRVVATTNRVVPQTPDRGPAQRRPRRLAQLQPADAGRLAGHLPRRPRHRRPRAWRRHPGPDLPDHRRHERDRDAGRLGRRRPLPSLAAMPAGAAALGGAADPRGPFFATRAGEIAAWGRENDGAAGGPSSSRASRAEARVSGEKLRGWDSNPQPFG